MKNHAPTAATRSLVELHTSVGTRQEVIADLLEIDPKTLRKHYRKELDHSVAKANAAIGGALFSKAKSGDTASMIFWLKTRAGWKETLVHEGANGGPIAVTYVSPLAHKPEEGYDTEGE
jgi:hypothetical protein